MAPNPMRILGIDPGLERIGYGMVVREGSKLTPVDFGLIETPRIALADRLLLSHERLSQLIDELRPDALATERLLFSVNKKTAIDVAKSLGALLLAGSQKGLQWTEYTPPEIKQAVVGTGAADKRQVQFMVTKLLSLRETPKPDDVADALAIAICHAFRSRVGV
jgi:crossover junction endodeoxyribonuclease RuvC